MRLTLASLMCVVAIAALVSPASAAKPNIVLLYADDLGYGELGCYGQKMFDTPVLDDLAAKGVRFTQFYAGNAVCGPSRASLMTGKHPGHATVRGNSAYRGEHRWERVALKRNEETIPEMLKRAGYQTAIIGKWHLEDPNDRTTWAHARGFDYAVHAQWRSRFGGEKFNPNDYYVNGENPIRYDPTKYSCMDEFRTDLAMAWLDKADRGKPFFLFMSYKIPHTPENDINDDKLYADRGWPNVERQHAGRITLLDRQVGRLLEHLRKMGVEENTLVVFTSDNGSHREGGHDHRFFKSSGVLRGHKRDLYEGGIRVPTIAYWKGKIKPGKTSDHIAAQWDLMATFAQAAGVEPTEGLDSLSFMPTLLGGKQPKHEYVYWEIQLDGWWRTMPLGGFRQGIRKGDWKAVRYGVMSKTELYNLAEDISETNNVAAQHPELVGEFEKLFKTARTDTPGFPYGGRVQDYRGSERYQW